MSDFFSPNWNKIDEAINGTDQQRNHLRLEYHKLCATVKEKLFNYYSEKRVAEAKSKMTALKKLSAGSNLYYTNINKDHMELILGKVSKIKDGKVYMLVKAESGKGFRINYKDLQIEPLTDEQIQSVRINARIQGIEILSRLRVPG